MEVRVNRSTQVTISLDSEAHAGKIMSLLMEHMDFSKEAWARDLYDSLSEQEIAEHSYAALPDDAPESMSVHFIPPGDFF